LGEAEAKLKFVQDDAQEKKNMLDLANRLVNGLSDENKRWSENVVEFKEDNIKMIGNALVSAGFVSYIGPFSFTFRTRLWGDTWMDDIKAKKIPYTEGVDPLTVLASPSDMAIWQTQGLPADRVSLENASVVSSCTRFPLIIDP